METSPSPQASPASIGNLIAQGKERLGLGDHVGARSLLTTAVEESDKSEQRVPMPGRAQSSQSAGLCLLRMGRARESLVHLHQAIAPTVFAAAAAGGTASSAGGSLQRRRTAELETAQTLHCLALAHAALREHHEAVGYYKRSLALFKRHKQTAVEARGLLRLAASYAEIPGRAETAARCYDRAEALYAHAGKPDWQAYVQALRAHLLLETGEREAAAVKLELATVLVQSSEDPKLKCRVFSAAGQTYAAMGRCNVAVVCFKQALSMARQTAGNLQQEATLQANIGAVLAVEEEYKEAITFHQKAIASFERLGQRSSLASTLANFGQTLLSANRLDAAVATVHHAVNVARVTGDVATAARCAETLAGVHGLRGDAGEERRCLRAALKSLAHLGDASDVSSDVDRLVDKLRTLDLGQSGGGDGGGGGGGAGGMATELGQSQVSNLSTMWRNIGGGTEMLEGTMATMLVVSPTVTSLGSLSSDSSIDVSDIDDFFDVLSDLSDSDGEAGASGARAAIATRRETSDDSRRLRTPAGKDSPDVERRRLNASGGMVTAAAAASSLHTPVATAESAPATRRRNPEAPRPGAGGASSSQPQSSSNKPAPLDLSAIAAGNTSARPRSSSAAGRKLTGKRGSEEDASPHIAHRRLPSDATNSQLMANMANMAAQRHTPELGRTLSGLGVLPSGALVLDGGVLPDSPPQSPGGRAGRQRRASELPGKPKSKSSVCLLL